MRREFTAKVKREAIARSNFICEGVSNDGIRCLIPVGRGSPVEYDHILPDWMGGEPTLNNCQCLCRICHKIKTALDAVDRGKARRRSDQHNGISAPRQRLVSRGFAKAPPQRNASRPLTKVCNPPFNR